MLTHMPIVVRKVERGNRDEDSTSNVLSGRAHRSNCVSWNADGVFSPCVRILNLAGSATNGPVIPVATSILAAPLTG
jgi:hypothetical protein